MSSQPLKIKELCAEHPYIKNLNKILNQIIGNSVKFNNSKLHKMFIEEDWDEDLINKTLGADVYFNDNLTLNTINYNVHHIDVLIRSLQNTAGNIDLTFVYFYKGGDARGLWAYYDPIILPMNSEKVQQWFSDIELNIEIDGVKWKEYFLREMGDIITAKKKDIKSIIEIYDQKFGVEIQESSFLV